MTRSKEIINTIILLLVIGAVFSLYIGTQRKAMTSSPAFVYDEIVAQKQVLIENRSLIKPAAKLKEIAVPQPINPVSIVPPITPPRVISQVLPEYPASALENEIEGMTLVQAYVGLNGAVDRTEIKTSSGNADLDVSAVKAVFQWTFSPALQGGAAIASLFEVPVRFSIK